MKRVGIGIICLLFGLLSCAKDDPKMKAMAGYSQPAWQACSGSAAAAGWPVSDVSEHCYERQNDLWCSDEVIDSLQTRLHQCCVGAKGQFYKTKQSSQDTTHACKLPNGDVEADWLISDCIARGGSVLTKLPSVLIPSDYGYCEPYGGYDRLRQEQAEQTKDESFEEFNRLD